MPGGPDGSAGQQALEVEQVGGALALADQQRLALDDHHLGRARPRVVVAGHRHAGCENQACLGCYTAVTTQMLNHLINGDELMFCKSCGRLLYLVGHEEGAPKASKKKAAK